LHQALERRFPEKRLFLKSDTETRFIRLGPGTQIMAWAGGGFVVAWAILATSILIFDNIGAGNFREQAMRANQIAEERLAKVEAERDARAEEAFHAQDRFNSALQQISVMQAQLLEAEDRYLEAEMGLEAVQLKLKDALEQRDDAEAMLAALRGGGDPGEMSSEQMDLMAGMIDRLTERLAETASERDERLAMAEQAISRAEEMALEIRLMDERNDQIFRQLEEAMAVSVEPLDKMFRAAGMPTDRILEEVRRGYSGQGGPLTPLSFSTKGGIPDATTLRANAILEKLDTLNLYRIAAERAPFAQPVTAAFRFTSPFGYRRDPKTGGRRMHNGVDFAAGTGTPIYATADGVVTHAGWSSGYGRLVKIQHDFGIETRYAHNTRLHVSVGEKVSRGQRIADMGATGRVTGTHLHYEVRVGGNPVNPMIFIRAANDVF
jgi:murein DD-endopeptidase MepM/ murein hydrolase activator NlpD